MHPLPVDVLTPCMGLPQGGADVQRAKRPACRRRHGPGGLLEAEGSKGGQEEGPPQEPGGPERRAGLHPLPRLREGGAARRYPGTTPCLLHWADGEFEPRPPSIS